MTSPKTDRSNLVSDFLLASISTSLGKTAVAPLERVKLLLQLQDASTQITQQTKYSGIIDCFARVYREQGLRSFWRGNLANVLRYFPAQATSFALKDFVKRHTHSYDSKTEFSKFLLANMLAGGFAGLVSTVIVYPLDFARTRLAMDIGRVQSEKEFRGLGHVFQKTWADEGIAGLYRGLTITLPGVIIYRAAYFGCYDTFKELLSDDAGMFSRFLLAQVITTASGMLIYPTDTIRRRLMMQTSRKDVLYTGVFDCIQKIYRNEGFRSFYKGAFVNILRTTGGAIVLVVYDEAKKLFVT